jgi:hypothetical protein
MRIFPAVKGVVNVPVAGSGNVCGVEACVSVKPVCK